MPDANKLKPAFPRLTLKTEMQAGVDLEHPRRVARRYVWADMDIADSNRLIRPATDQKRAGLMWRRAFSLGFKGA